MVYQEFIDMFVKSEQNFLTYQQGTYLVRVVKIPLVKGVQALYATYTYRPKDKKENYGFCSNEKMEIAGFIDCKGELRFPTYTLTKKMAGYPNDIVENGHIKEIVGSIQEAVNKLALAMTLPACANEDAAYRRACERLFLAEKTKPLAMHNDFHYYINDGTLIDYLAETPNWAEKIAQKWASDLAGYKNGRKVTNLEVYREGIVFAQKVDEISKEIEADKSHKVHRYIAMKEAVKDAAVVTVEFKTNTGETFETKIPAYAFCNGNWDHQNKISLHVISPRKERDRIEKLLPRVKTEKGYEYPSNELFKDDIITIKYRGRILWGATSQGNQPCIE